MEYLKHNLTLDTLEIYNIISSTSIYCNFIEENKKYGTEEQKEIINRQLERNKKTLQYLLESVGDYRDAEWVIREYNSTLKCAGFDV